MSLSCHVRVSLKNALLSKILKDLKPPSYVKIPYTGFRKSFLFTIVIFVYIYCPIMCKISKKSLNWIPKTKCMWFCVQLLTKMSHLWPERVFSKYSLFLLIVSALSLWKVSRMRFWIQSGKNVSFGGSKIVFSNYSLLSLFYT